MTLIPQVHFKMLLILNWIMYVILLIKRVLSSLTTFFVSAFTVDKDQNKHLKDEEKNESPSHKNQVGNNKIKTKIISPNRITEEQTKRRFKKNKKISKMELENASFAKPTKSSTMKRKSVDEDIKAFPLNLRSFNKKTINSLPSKLNTTSLRDVINDRRSSKQVNEKLIGPTINENETQEVSNISPMQSQTFIVNEEKGPEMATCDNSTTKVYRVTAIKQLHSDDSQIFSDESQDGTVSPMSKEENIAETIQLLLHEENKMNEMSHEITTATRIENGLAKINKLASEMNADKHPLYRRIFANLRIVNEYLCRTVPNWELGTEYRKQTPIVKC